MEQLDNTVVCALSSDSVRRLIVFDYHPEVDDEREKFEAARVRLTDGPVVLDSLAEVIERGTTAEEDADIRVSSPQRAVDDSYANGYANSFRAAVRTAKIGPDNDIPHLSESLIRKYANDLRTLGLI